MAGQGGAAASGIWVSLLLGTALLGCLMLSDVRRRRLPNSGVLLLALAYLFHWWLQGQSVGTLLQHMATALAGLLLFACFYAARWMAGGDVKLAAAVLLWAGPGHALDVLTITAAGGGCMAGAQLLAASRLAPSSVWHASRGTPYGVALAAGGLWAVWRPVIGHGALF
jgi:prepilin peptidase CpaA